MPSAIPAHSRALDALEASVNSILLQTGSAFCDPTNYDSWKIARTSTQLKHTLPPALCNFHDALDELERELIRARAVLQRDFANSQMHQTSAATQNGRLIVSPAQSPSQADISMSDVPQPTTETNEAKGLDPMDHTAKTEEESPSAHAIPVTNGEVKQSRNVQEEQSLETESSSALTNVLDSKIDKREDVQVENNGTNMVTAEDAKPVVVASTPLNGDTLLPSGSNDYYTHDDVFGSTPNTANMTPNDQLLSAVDVNSLLPGLEFYANDNSTGAEDSFDGFVNLSNSATNDFMLDDGTMGVQSLPSMPMDDLMGGDDASNMNFDDFFASYGGDTNSAVGGQTQGLGDAEDTSFDESFFNLDPS